MSNGTLALARHEGPSAVVRREDAAFTENEIDLIKTQIAPGVSDGELKLFLHVCQSRRLDPFSKQIYAVVRSTWDPNTRTNKEKMTIMTAIDGFRLNAKRGGVEAIDEPEFEYDGQLRSRDNPLGLVKASVRVWRAGIARPTVGVAYWDEYRAVKKDGSLSGKWADMPRTMLAKCAEAQALRKAAPEELSGLYSPEEMDQADNPPGAQPTKVVEAVQSTETRLYESFAKRIDDATDEKTLKKIGAELVNAKLPDDLKKKLRGEYAHRRNKLAKDAREVTTATVEPPPSAPAEVAPPTDDTAPDSDRGSDRENY
jgi:phage recombination protein Bet